MPIGHLRALWEFHWLNGRGRESSINIHNESIIDIFKKHFPVLRILKTVATR
jgi:hypothetical protein